jgi:hypothetical protein
VELDSHESCVLGEVAQRISVRRRLRRPHQIKALDGLTFAGGEINVMMWLVRIALQRPYTFRGDGSSHRDPWNRFNSYDAD